MSEIKEKLDAEMKTVKSMCECMENAIKTQMDKGLDHVDTHELYKAVDIYKDLSEVKKNIAKTCYYKQIMEAMEESEYGKDYDENGEIRYYRGQPRRANGEFMSRRGGRSGRRGYTDREWENDMPYIRPELYHMYPPYEQWERDMDIENGKMYYTENKGQHGYAPNGQNVQESGSSRAMRKYMEDKMTADGTTKMKDLESYMSELSGDVTKMLANASQGEKDMVKQKMQVLMTKF